MDAVESIQHSGDAFKRVFPLLAADHAQTREQLRTSPFPNLKRLADILDDDPAIRRRQDQIYNIRLQTSRTVVALVDVDRIKELHAALAAVTYKGGFELVNIDDDNSSVRLCDCCKDFLQNPAFETGTLDAFQSPVKRRPTKNHHDTFFQLMGCCYSSRPGCRLCQALWRNFEIQLRKVGHCFWHDGPFNLYIKRWEGSNMSFIISNIMRCINASSASSMTQFRLYGKTDLQLV